MKNSLWAVIVIVVGFLGFLIGYSVSSYTGIQKIQGGFAAEAEAGGYGQESGDSRKESAADREESEDYGERTGYYGVEK